MMKALLRFARAVVQSVLSQLTQQLNIVQEAALAPMRAMVQAVTGGVWIGKGADAFVQEVSSMMIPGVGQVMQHIQGVQQNLNRATEIIDKADNDVNSMVNQVSDVFEGIF
jgi:uncharacterized protein YukE